MKILKFGAVWCPACLIMNKTLKKINSDIEIISYDYDIDSEKVEEYNIGKVLPVLVFVDDNNKEINRLIGEQTKEKIEDVIARM